MMILTPNITENVMTLFQSARRALRRPASPGRILSHIWHAHRIWQERQSLTNMGPSLLDDIGINRAEAMAEAARPIWDVPQTWRN